MKFKGHIMITDDNGKCLVDTHNTITSFYEEVVATAAIDTLFTHSCAFEAGQSFIYAPQVYISSYHRHTLLQPTAYFLNLTAEEKAALSKDSNLLPIYKSGTFEIDTDKIVGYAKATYQASEPKEGCLAYVQGENLVNTRRHGLRWHWEVGAMTGTYNCIAIGIDVLSDRFAGIWLSRGLEQYNTILGETASTGYYLPPGIHSENRVITADDEVLLPTGTNTDVTIAGKVLNLTTGITENLASDDHRYGLKLINGSYPFYVYNGKFITKDSSVIKYRDIDTWTSGSSCTNLSMSLYGYSVFEYDGYLYVGESTTSTSSGTVFNALNLETMKYESSKNKTFADLNLPDDFIAGIGKNDCAYYISSIGDKYLVCLRNANSSYNQYGQYGYQKAFICTNPFDMKNSIYTLLPNFNGYYGFAVGSEIYLVDYLCMSGFYNGDTWEYLNVTGSTKQVKKDGLKITKPATMTGNMFSFHTFETDQAISEEVGTNLDYYYHFDKEE